MSEDRQAKEKLERAQRDYELLEQRIAPFVRRKPVRAARFSEWQSESTPAGERANSCVPSRHCCREL